MRNVAAALARILRPLNLVALWCAGAGLVAMTCIVFYQVFGRYVLNRTPAWAEASAILLMSWFILLGAAVGVRERTHLGFDVLRHVVPRKVQVAMLAVSAAVVCGFGAMMALYGWQLAQGTWTARIPTLGLPGGFQYIPLVIGGTLIALFSLERLVRLLAGEEA